MRITPEALFLSLLFTVSWIAAAVLCVLNLILIYRPIRELSFRRRHTAILAGYVLLTILLCNLSTLLPNDQIADPIRWPLAWSIPWLIIGHFLYLLIYRYRHRLRRKNQS